MRHLIQGLGLAVLVAAASSVAAVEGDPVLVAPHLDSPAAYYGLSPCRALDTRTSGGPVYTYSLEVASGPCAIPRSARAVILTLQVVSPRSPGYLQAYSPEATSGQRPKTSVLAWSERRIATTEATVWLGITGPDVEPTVVVRSTTKTDLVIDVVGYYAPLPTRD